MLDKPNVIKAARATMAEPSQSADKTLAPSSWQDPDLQSSLPLRLTWTRPRGPPHTGNGLLNKPVSFGYILQVLVGTCEGKVPA